MHVRVLRSTFGALCCSALFGMLAAPPASGQEVQKSDQLVSAPGRRVRLGLERPGSRLAVATVAPKSYIAASRERFVVVRGGASNVLRDLNDLRGHVRISSKSSALRFVRLRTTPRTFYFWPFFQQQKEVVSRRVAAQLPRYGVDSWRGFRPSAESGWLGVLSPSAYSLGGFRAPSVSTGTQFLNPKNYLPRLPRMGRWAPPAPAPPPGREGLSEVRVSLSSSSAISRRGRAPSIP